MIPETRRGAELNAVVAERVMGETLSVPRERAMAIVGAFYTRVTGRRFTVQVRDYETTIPMQDGDSLPAHPSDDNWNQRYFRHVAAELLKFPNEIGEAVEADIAACRLTAKPYSTDLATAWLVVEKMRANGWQLTLTDTPSAAVGAPQNWGAMFGVWDASGPEWTHRHGAIADTAPLAICLAALAALPVSGETRE